MCAFRWPETENVASPADLEHGGLNARVRPDVRLQVGYLRERRRAHLARVGLTSQDMTIPARIYCTDIRN
jgi:hypothetical protein